MLDARIRLRHINCFLETARRGALSEAAAALNISQPAASKTIKELEEILGKPLFDRSGRRLVLTQSGRLFQQHGGAAILELGRAQELVRDAPPQVTRLAVGVLPTAATEFLPKAALAFRASNPNCLLRVSTGPNWLLMSQLREGQLDLVVGRMSSAEVMAGLSFTPLYAEQISAVLRVDHPLLREREPMQALGSYPLILPPPGAVISPLVRAFLSRHDIGTEGIAFETVALAFGRKVVQRSDAVWFISQGVVQDEVEAGRLATLDLPEMPGGPVGISLRSETIQREEIKVLIAALEAAV
jgi:LysR family pca operon transcriptional activator